MPKAPARFALRLSLPLLLICWSQPDDLLAQQQQSRFALRLHGGVAVMPLQEWETFWGQVDRSRYNHPTADLFVGASIGFRLAPRHSLSLGVERLSSTANLTNVGFQTNEDADAIGVLDVIQFNWEFTGVALALKYTRHFSIKTGGWSPHIGVGISYYLTEVKIALDYLYAPYLGPSLNEALAPRQSTGYGLALIAGVDIPLTRTFYLSNQARYRWADGTAFDEPESITVSFTGYDLSIGLAWQF